MTQDEIGALKHGQRTPHACTLGQLSDRQPERCDRTQRVHDRVKRRCRRERLTDEIVSDAAINLAMQLCIASGIGWAALNHPRKASANNPARGPNISWAQRKTKRAPRVDRSVMGIRPQNSSRSASLV